MFTTSGSVFSSVHIGSIARSVQAKRAREKLFYFFRYAWPVIDPDPLEWNWHLGVIGEHLQAVTDMEIFKLIITIPPGFAKSLTTAVLWPAWEWIDHPWEQSLVGSYEEGLVFRDANRMRDLITSKWYIDTFQPDWSIRGNKNSVEYFINTKRGNRKAFYIHGRKKTGWRGRKIILDDSLSADDRYNPSVKNKTWDVISKVLPSRFNNPATAAMIMMGQRLAADDPIGRMLAIKDNGYTVLSLAARYDPKQRCTTSVRFNKAAMWPPPGHPHCPPPGTAEPATFEDPRTEKGQELFVTMYPETELVKLENLLGPEDFSAQYQQNPTDNKNQRFNKDDFRFWTEATVAGSRCPVIYLPRDDGNMELVRLDMLWTMASCDFAVSEEMRANFSVIVSWAITHKNDMILMDMYRDRVAEPDLVNMAFRIHSKKNYAGGRHSVWVCESNGINKPIIQTMSSMGIPCHGINVSKDKFSRSITAAVRVKAGQIFFPQPADHPWVMDIIKELTEFPLGQQDDIVDAISIGAHGLFEGYLNTIVSSKTAEIGKERKMLSGKENDKSSEEKLRERLNARSEGRKRWNMG